MTGTWASSWSDGDIVTAAEFKKQIGSIYDTTLSVAAANIDVTGILSTYAHLLITTYLRSDTASGSTNVLLRFNGDSGTNYDTQSLVGNAATTSAAENFGQNAAQIGVIPAGTAVANLFCGGQIFVPHYAGSSNNKQIIALDANKVGTATTNMAVHLFGTSWRSSAAVSRVTFFPNAGNFAIGSRVTIHAMGA